MSLQTFKNLPIERQKEIIELSLKEFAFKEYESASLSAIIKNLNLAKGSFYRYFKNKKSLYLYLLNYVIEFRLQNEKNILDGSIVNFFDMMVENFAAKIRFDIEYPLFGAFLHNVMQEKNSEELGDIQAEIKNKILKMHIHRQLNLNNFACSTFGRLTKIYYVRLCGRKYIKKKLPTTKSLIKKGEKCNKY